MSADYTVMGATMTVDTFQNQTPPDIVLDIIVDSEYRNQQHTTPCQVDAYFGGGVCEPDDVEKEIFEALNLVRTDPWNQ